MSDHICPPTIADTSLEGEGSSPISITTDGEYISLALPLTYTYNLYIIM